MTNPNRIVRNILKDTRSNDKKSKKKEYMDAAMALDFLKSGGGIFKGMNVNGVKIGQKAIVQGKGVTTKGHEPPIKYAQLSDGSRIVMSGQDKGLRIK